MENFLPKRLQPKLQENCGHNSEKKSASMQFVDILVRRVHETGSLMDKTSRLRTRPVRLVENIPEAAESVNDYPSTSTRHRAQELDISRTSLQRIFTKDLRLRCVWPKMTIFIEKSCFLMRPFPRRW